MLFFVGNTAASETVEPDWESLKNTFERSLKREMRRKRLVGLSLAVVYRDQVVWAQGYGESDRKARQPASADTRYEIGDISKAITALAALRLVERGKLDLDAGHSHLLAGLGHRVSTAQPGASHGAPTFNPSRRRRQQSLAGLLSDGKPLLGYPRSTKFFSANCLAPFTRIPVLATK